MKQKIKLLLATIMMLAGITAQAATTVTWNNSDISGSGKSFTKGGVTMNVTGIVCDFTAKIFSVNHSLTFFRFISTFFLFMTLPLFLNSSPFLSRITNLPNLLPLHHEKGATPLTPLTPEMSGCDA